MTPLTSSLRPSPCRWPGGGPGCPLYKSHLLTQPLTIWQCLYIWQKLPLPVHMSTLEYPYNYFIAVDRLIFPVNLHRHQIFYQAGSSARHTQKRALKTHILLPAVQTKNPAQIPQAVSYSTVLPAESQIQRILTAICSAVWLHSGDSHANIFACSFSLS